MTRRILLAALAGLWAAGCASTGGVPRPFPTPEPATSTPDARVPTDQSPVTAGEAPLDGFLVAGRALEYRGTPYRFGGADPQTGFDCSGLVQHVFGRYGISMPREVQAQYRVGSTIRPADVRPGDLLFFATEGRDASHVAIAISALQFVHAPNSAGVVRVEALNADYWSSRYLGARRVITAPR